MKDSEISVRMKKECQERRANWGKMSRVGIGGTLLIIFAVGMFVAGGCARNISGSWAQTSPLIKADHTHSTVNLGVRGR